MENRNSDLQMSVTEFCERYYLPDCEHRLRRSTLLYYQYIYKNHVKPTFSKELLREVSALDIREWQNVLISQGFSDNYLRALHSYLSRIFDFAVRYYDLETNPCIAAGSIGRHRNVNKYDVWTLDECQTVVDAIPEIEYKTQVSLLFWSGIRRGELYGLQWQDFAFDTGELNIVRNYQRLLGEAVIQPPKTESGIRSIILPSLMADMLRSYRELCGRVHDTSFIFTWRKRKLDDAIDKACEATGIKKIRVHDLRHSHASLLINMNQDIASISKRLGHSSISMTLDTYTHVYDRGDAAIANALDRISVNRTSVRNMY